jgi:hypothetical protein
MGFLISDMSIPYNAKLGLLQGSNYVSLDYTKLGNKNVKEFNFNSENKVWYKVNDWSRLAQNRISEYLPHPIEVNNEEAMFLMGGYLHGLDSDTTVPEFDYTLSDNLMSDLLAYSLILLINGDLSSAYATLQTWLFLGSIFENDHAKTTSSFLTEQKDIIEFTL